MLLCLFGSRTGIVSGYTCLYRDTEVWIGDVHRGLCTPQADLLLYGCYPDDLVWELNLVFVNLPRSL